MSEKPDIEPLARKILSYPPYAILTQAEVAEWLGVSAHTVKMWPLPRLSYPTGLPRYSAGAVLAFLENRLDAYLKRAV